MLAYLYLFEISTVEVGRDYFFYFCLLLSLEVFLIVGGCLLCACSKRSAHKRKHNPFYFSTNNRGTKRTKSNASSQDISERSHLLTIEEEDDIEGVHDEFTDDEDWQSARGEDDEHDAMCHIDLSMYSDQPTEGLGSVGRSVSSDHAINI